MKRSNPAVLSRLQATPIDDVCMSVVTKSELLYGVEVSPRRAQDATALDGAVWTRDLVEKLRIPRLSAYGMKPEDFSLREAVQKTQNANSFKGNPIVLSERELMNILQQAL